MTKSWRPYALHIVAAVNKLENELPDLHAAIQRMLDA